MTRRVGSLLRSGQYDMCHCFDSVIVRRFRQLGLGVALCAVVHARSARAAEAVTPPTVVEQVAPEWPDPPQDHDIDVPVVVTVAADGSVSDVVADSNAGAEYAAAAVAAVRRWKFTPALRAGAPVASRVRALVHFVAAPPKVVEPAASPTDLPLVESRPAPSPPSPPSATPAAAPPAQPPPPERTEIMVRGQTTPVLHGASDLQIPIGALRTVPRANASDYLKLAPGILLTNEGG
ncbi:MAG TPA: TonB family protein, partial [Polyangiaceae bacterium]|nr:TonB family protein [Polyangiaceae bacterium]